VSDNGLSQIGAALAAEIAAVADLGPELLGRVGSAARRAERHRMVRTQLEEQRSESDEQQHDVRIVVLEARDCQAGRRNKFGGICGFGWIVPDRRAPLLQLLRWDSSIPVCGDLSTAPGNRPRFRGSFRRSLRYRIVDYVAIVAESHGAAPTGQREKVIRLKRSHMFAAVYPVVLLAVGAFQRGNDVRRQRR